MLRRAGDRDDLGGEAVVWYAAPPKPLTSSRLVIQPGIADDLPSLLSALAVEIGWPGVTPPPSADAARAVAAWARVWQVREQADLRVTLRWDAAGMFQGTVEQRALDAPPTPLLSTNDVLALLERVAAAPETSTSPHGMLLAGNRAMQAEDYLRARELYQQAVHDLPHHPEARRNLALALARLEAWEDAATEMARAWALRPDDPALAREYLALETDAGIRAVQRGALAPAAEHFLRILRHWPTEPTALANLGTIRHREGRLPEARAIYQRFLREHPHHVAAEQIRQALAEITPPT